MPPAIQPTVGQSEEGIASWYGNPYHGRQAADGEVYDMETMVAAHRTLPFQTWVRVYNLDNQKTVDVRIIDRGPFIDGRIIDLSHAAASEIDMIGPGTARVRIEIIRAAEAIPARPVAQARPAVQAPQPAPTPAHFAVQVGTFRDRANAERLMLEMTGRYGTALVVPAGDPGMWRVMVGDESSESAAGALADRIRQEGGERLSAFVVRL